MESQVLFVLFTVFIFVLFIVCVYIHDVYTNSCVYIFYILHKHQKSAANTHSVHYYATGWFYIYNWMGV